MKNKFKIVLVAFLGVLVAFLLVRQIFLIRVTYGGDYAQRELITVTDYSEPLFTRGNYYIYSEVLSQKEHVFCNNSQEEYAEMSKMPGVHLVELTEKAEFRDTFLVNAIDSQCLSDAEKTFKCDLEDTAIQFEIYNKKNKMSIYRYGCFDEFQYELK